MGTLEDTLAWDLELPLQLRELLQEQPWEELQEEELPQDQEPLHKGHRVEACSLEPF